MISTSPRSLDATRDCTAHGCSRGDAVGVAVSGNDTATGHPWMIVGTMRSKITMSNVAGTTTAAQRRKRSARSRQSMVPLPRWTANDTIAAPPVSAGSSRAAR